MRQGRTSRTRIAKLEALNKAREEFYQLSDGERVRQLQALILAEEQKDPAQRSPTYLRMAEIFREVEKGRKRKKNSR